MAAHDLIILDFDGTFTDVEKEAIPFLGHYQRGLAEIVGAPIEESWTRALATVRSEPDAHGFRFDGRIVAPSHADPYILSSCVSQIVLDEFGLRSDIDGLDSLFHQSYRYADTVFRPDALDVAERALAQGVPVYVVSNSRTDNVVAKLEKLSGDLLARLEVRGDARKFHLVEPESADVRFDAVAEVLALDGLPRDVYLRRGRYFDALRAIWDATDTTPARTLVCGDIFELDLALPAALGATVHLVGREDTPEWERRAVAKSGSFSTELSGLLQYFA